MSLQKKSEEESKKVPEDYRRFVYIEPDTVPSTPFNQESSTLESSVTKSQEVLTELMEPELLSDATKKVLTESEEPEQEQPEPEIEVQRDNNEIHSKGKEPVLAKYVRRHHSVDQIIGDKSEGTLTRS